jgi:putative nucleotidyltransferase with HDIG domain
MTRPSIVRVAILIATSVGAWMMLSLGSGDLSSLEPGQLAPRDYRARIEADVLDEVATEDARDAAEAAEPDVLSRDEGAEQASIAVIEGIISATVNGVMDPEAVVPSLLLPEQTSGTTAIDSSSTTTALPTVEVAGRVFLDVNDDAAFTEGEESVDRGLGRISVVIFDETGTEIGTAETQSDGSWRTQVTAVPMWAAVDGSDPDFPASLTIATANDLQQVECDDLVCTSVPVGYKPAIRSAEVQITELREQQPNLDLNTVDVLVAYANGDVIRSALGEPKWLDAISAGAQNKLADIFATRPTAGDLSQIRDTILNNPPLVLIGSTPDLVAGAAAADIVANAVRANYVFDREATEEQRAEARAAVADIVVSYQVGEVIASRDQRLTQLQIDAIRETQAINLAESGQSLGLLAVLTAMTASIGLYLARFRREFWDRPRMAALLGLLIVLAAGAVRLTVQGQGIVDEVAAWYLLPTVIFGLMTTVLFDSRVAAVMSLAMAVLVATGTRDSGLTAYAAMSTMIPVGFVSSLTSRGGYRKAVLASAASVAVLAAAVAWFFHTTPDQQPWEVIGASGVLAAGISVLTALLGLAVLQFFESAFDITTNLRLLELTDLNHEALALLQEKAFGTFNHSLMVGTLADAAARAVGANPLLARAAAYYHDLGKTVNPTFFIENQFGGSNPHDEIPPRQSVEMIRQHVTEGVKLARRYKIPTEVAEAIVSHHGDGIMRFFYEKARISEGEEIAPDDFRHVGHKPRSAEMAIVMLADSLEAACRAVFQAEEPTPQAIEKVVSRVIDEKVNDGQLTESSLTLAQLTRARRAFLEALVGHYHQRILYPNFPGN